MNSGLLYNEIIEAARSLTRNGLSAGTSGNVSGRTDAGFLITPSGVDYADLEPASLVEMDLGGNTVGGDLIPSSEWRFHRAVYAARPDVNAIVHVHSPCATALACTRRGIPAFHYMVAMAGGGDIPCADYATFGTEALAQNTVAALAGRRACLLANHGMIAIGDSVGNALDLTVYVEELARQYILSCQLGGPVLLDEQEMSVNLEKFKTYGKQDP